MVVADQSLVEPCSLEAKRQQVTISAVIPTLNEAANLPHVFARIPACVDEVIIVDGHSTDDTIVVARTLMPTVRIVVQDGRGKGNALARGFAAARGDIIVMLDADGSTDPQEIPHFIQPLVDGADFVKGSRCLAGGGSVDISRARSMGNGFLTAVVNLLYRRHYTDLCYGYNAFWRHCLSHINVDCDGFEVETLIHVRVAKTSLIVTEVPSMEHRRIYGESNLRAIRDGWRVLRTIVTERVAARGPKDLAIQPSLVDPGPNYDIATAQCDADRLNPDYRRSDASGVAPELGDVHRSVGLA